jgi:hypothetical protein
VAGSATLVHGARDAALSFVAEFRYCVTLAKDATAAVDREGMHSAHDGNGSPLRARYSDNSGAAGPTPALIRITDGAVA